MKLTAVKGMNDIVPPESFRWQWLEAQARQVFECYHYAEIRTPLVERTELFIRSVGETSAVVEKEMYTFQDKNEEWLSLRPEATASVVRAFMESGVASQEGWAKYYYLGPMYRYERPQKGRYREFYQIGIEWLGCAGPWADVEVMAAGEHFLKAVGVKGVELQLNSIGCETCRPPYQKKLHAFLEAHASELCEDCERRLRKNPLRVFDCKNARCQKTLAEAPLIREAWCADCREHHAVVQSGLATLAIPFVDNPRIVRGLDYYRRTAFEFVAKSGAAGEEGPLGAQNALIAGGRYDGLVKALGGPDLPGVGFAMGVERLLALTHHLPTVKKTLVAFVPLGEKVMGQALQLMQMARAEGIAVAWDAEGRSLKSQLRRTDKWGASFVVMLGDEEFKRQAATVRDMKGKTQEEVAWGELIAYLRKVC